MPIHSLDDYVKTSLESVSRLTEENGLLGRSIETPSGVCIIPVTQLKIAFASGNLDFSTKKNLQGQNNGGGGATVVSVTPIAYLTVSKNGETDYISVNGKEGESVEKIADVIGNAPEILKQIKDVFS